MFFFFPDQTKSFPAGLQMHPAVCKLLVFAKMVMSIALRTSALSLGPRPSSAFSLCWKKPSLFTPVCYTNTIFNESHDVEKFKKTCCTIYLVVGGIVGSVGNYPNNNSKYGAYKTPGRKRDNLFLIYQFLKCLCLLQSFSKDPRNTWTVKETIKCCSSFTFTSWFRKKSPSLW